MSVKKHIGGLCLKAFDATAKQKQHQKAPHTQLLAMAMTTIARPVASTILTPPRPKLFTTQASAAIPAAPRKSTPKKAPPKAQIPPADIKHDHTLQAAQIAKTTAGVNALGKSRPQLVVGLDTPHHGNTYTKLSKAQQRTIQQKLLGLCHPQERLQKEGYVLTDCPLPPVSPRLPGLRVPKTTIKAMVIDCEMGRTVKNDRELIHLTVIDFFTGRVLLNRLVSPTRPIGGAQYSMGSTQPSCRQLSSTTRL